MIARRAETVAEIESQMARGAKRTRVLLFVLTVLAGVLFVINALTRTPDVHAPLAQQWWSLIPILALAVLAAMAAARRFWLQPRELAVRRYLVAARPLHAPWAAARAVEERLLSRIADLPEPQGAARAVLASGRKRLAELLQAPVEDEVDTVLRRRAAGIDAYRVALTTLETDALIKRDLLASDAVIPTLERAIELLGRPGDRGARSDDIEELAPRVGSIAVLPFADLSPLGDQEYFGQGLADELISALNRIRGLQVAARSRAFPYARQGLSVREVGRRLGVEAVVEGSVQRVGDRLSVSAQLHDVEQASELWWGEFEEDLDRSFEIGNDLVEGVLQALEVRPTSEEKRTIEKPPTQVGGAYDLYLRGRRYFAQYHGRGIEFALDMFSRAVELDSRFALAWAGIADCSAYLYANKGREPRLRERALEASATALELDPELPEAHVARGVALSQGGRPEDAAQHFETALRLDPQLFEAHYFYARHCFTAGEPEKALELYEGASELRPEDYQVPLLSAQIYDDLGRLEEGRRVRERGVKVAEEHIRLNPDDARALYIGANGLVALGRIEKGLEWARLARDLQPKEPMTLYNLACVYSLAGAIDEAIDCFSACVDNGFSYRDWAEHDSNLDALRSDPRFIDVMEKL